MDEVVAAAILPYKNHSRLYHLNRYVSLLRPIVTIHTYHGNNKFTFFHGRNTQILCYLIPWPTGELSEGKRRLNWVWYYNVSAGNELQLLLKDKYGKQREFSVPQGMVRDN